MPADAIGGPSLGSRTDVRLECGTSHSGSWVVGAQLRCRGWSDGARLVVPVPQTTQGAMGWLNRQPLPLLLGVSVTSVTSVTALVMPVTDRSAASVTSVTSAVAPLGVVTDVTDDRARSVTGWQVGWPGGSSSCDGCDGCDGR